MTNAERWVEQQLLYSTPVELQKDIMGHITKLCYQAGINRLHKDRISRYGNISVEPVDQLLHELDTETDVWLNRLFALQDTFPVAQYPAPGFYYPDRRIGE